MAIASATSETTIESPIMFQSGVAVSDDRMAVVHHVSGLHHATIDSHVDEPLIGNTEPDRSHMGMNTRFMTLWKEEALWHRQANASPMADIARLVMASENRVSSTPTNPAGSSMNGMAARRIPAWRKATVPPPSALPSAMDSRGAGETSTA